jgi:hypothetical protein
MIYRIISERFPIEFEKAVNKAISEGFQPLGGPFGWRDSLHQAVVKDLEPSDKEAGKTP